MRTLLRWPRTNLTLSRRVDQQIKGLAETRDENTKAFAEIKVLTAANDRPLPRIQEEGGLPLSALE